MSLGTLPTELLHAISQFVAASGSHDLLNFTRVNRRLHDIANPVLYSTDVRESGGVVSICHGLKTGLNSVVNLCLAAGVDPSIRINSREHLDNLANGGKAESLVSSESPIEDDRERDSLTQTTRYTLRCYWTPLHVAAAQGDVGLLEMLLDHGASPNSAGIGVCPCYYQSLRRTVGRSIPESPYESNKYDFLARKLVTRWSPLHVSICNGHLKCAERLIDRFGLAHAEESDDEVRNQARWFLDEEDQLRSEGSLPKFVYDSDEDWESPLDGYTPRFDPLPPLHVAADKYMSLEMFETVYLMLKRAGCLDGPRLGVDVLDAFGDTPFAVASFSGRSRSIGIWLRDHGADIDFVIARYGTQRHSIINALCVSLLYREATILMDMGVNVNKDNSLYGDDWSTLISNICSLSASEPERKREEGVVLLKRLIHAGADVNARSRNGHTALMSAVFSPFPAAVRVLLDAKADVHAATNQGMTALHWAVQLCFLRRPEEGRHREFDTALAMVRLLLDHGADPNHHCEGHGSPLFTDVYNLRNATNLSNCAFNLPGPNCMASLAPLMISRGADPNIHLENRSNLSGKSLVVSAFKLGEYDSLDALVASGAIVTRDDYLGMMRSLFDKPQRRGTSGAVDALFRILNAPSLKLEAPEDRKNIMKAWEEVLYHAVGRHPRLVHCLFPHVVLTDIRGLGGKNVLHLMAHWERHDATTPTEFEDQITNVLSDLLRCGAYRLMNEPDDFGQSPLQTAIDLENTAVAISLALNGADCHSETKKPDGSITMSPLKSAIRRYSKACFFDMASEMLDITMSDRTTMDTRDSQYLKDFLLHLGESSFDEPSEATSRTSELMTKLIRLGVDVDGTDEDGNTPLHLLFHLLESPKRCSEGPGDPQVSGTCGAPSSAVSRRAHSNISFDMDRPRLFELREEEGMNMNGQLYFDHYEEDDSDSDSDNNSEGEADVETLDGEDDIQNHVPDPGTPETSGATSPSTPIHPASETGKLVRNGTGLGQDRCDAWIESFLVLLDRGASLTVRNKAGKTVLDYIDELRDCQPHACPERYSSVIPALRDSVKRPPFDPALLAVLTNSEVQKGQPVLFVHDQFAHCMDKNGLEDAHEAERQACARGETFWEPFW